VLVLKQFICPVAVLPQVHWACLTLGITGLEDVLIDVRRITDVCDLPLLGLMWTLGFWFIRLLPWQRTLNR